MRTAQARSIAWLYRCIGWLGFAGFISGLSVDSTGGVIASGIFWWGAKRLVDHAWVYVEDGVVIFHEEVAIKRVATTCYLWSGDLPKEYSLMRIDSAVGVVTISLHVHSSREGGVIIPVDLTIGATVGQTIKDVTRYCQVFGKQNKKGSQYVLELFERFRCEQLRPKGAFGYIHSQHIGTPEWVELTLTKSLWDFLSVELSAAGLQIRSIGVICGKADKCIVLEGGS